MKLQIFLLCAYLLVPTLGLSLDTQQIYQEDTNYFTNGTPRDCEVGASNEIIGFFCAEQGYLFYHKKTEFLAGDLSTQSK